MKKALLITLFLLICSFVTYPHGQETHQYVVREAYKYLKYYVGQDIREMVDHLGYAQSGIGIYNPGGQLSLEHIEKMKKMQDTKIMGRLISMLQ